MKTLHKTSLSCLLTLLLVQGCGGGSNGGSGSGTAADKINASSVLSGPVRGVLTIEERANKRVMDAWFTRAESGQSSDVVLWEQEGQSCVVPGTIAQSASSAQSGTHWRQTEFAGESITLSSRSGAQITLRPQRYAEAVLYATSERWLPVPLPDDATLSVTGAAGVAAFDSVPLAPLTRLEQLAPENGVSFDHAQAVRWVPAGHAAERIELVVSALTGKDDALAISIKCLLDDASGQFELPSAVRARLPQGALLSYSLARIRTQTQHAGETTLEIVQVSYP